VFSTQRPRCVRVRRVKLRLARGESAVNRSSRLILVDAAEESLAEVVEEAAEGV